MAELTKEQVIKDNEMIAKFMGAVIARINTSPGTVKEFYSFGEFSDRGNEIVIASDHLNYHKDWNRLMPVVAKIEDIGGSFEFTSNKMSISWIDFSAPEKPVTSEGAYSDEIKFVLNPDISFKLYVVYKAVVKFINWYKRNKINYD